MTPEERQLLEGLFERIKSAAPEGADKEAEEFIGKSIQAMPHAGYVLSQAVIVQEEALKAAVAKIEELETSVKELQEKAEKASANNGFLGGLGKSIFGGGEPEPAAREERPFRSGGSGVPSTRRAGSGISVPPPPGGQPGSAFNQQGAAPGQPGQPASGGGGTFLKGALGAAAGVAGGMLLANAVGGLFSGKDNPLGIGGAKASESKDSSDKSSGDDKSDAGDDWSEDSNNSNNSDSCGDDWGSDNHDNDDWGDDGGDDWGDDGGDSWD